MRRKTANFYKEIHKTEIITLDEFIITSNPHREGPDVIKNVQIEITYDVEEQEAK